MQDHETISMSNATQILIVGIGPEELAKQGSGTLDCLPFQTIQYAFLKVATSCDWCNQQKNDWCKSETSESKQIHLN